MSSGCPRHTHSSRSQILISCKIPVPVKSAPTPSSYKTAMPAQALPANKRPPDCNYPQTVCIISGIHLSAKPFSSMSRQPCIDAPAENYARPLTACPNSPLF